MGARVRRTHIKLAALGVVALASVLLLRLTGGAGALVVAVLVTGALVALRRVRVEPERRIEWPGVLATIGVALAGTLVVWNTVSFARYVIPDNGEGLSTRAATWARNHGFNPVIDYLETKWYSDPPSVAPAISLALNNDLGLDGRPSATSTTPTATTAPATTEPATTAPATTAATTTTTTTTVPVSIPPAPPAPLTPQISPALAGEGEWVPIATAGGDDAIWATSIRPLASVGGVVASMALIDQTHLRVGMFNGSEEPGGSWQRSNRVPKDLQPALVAAMNGGFRMEHIKGGYVTEGRVVRALRDGDATLAVGRDGRLVIGRYGRDLVDDGTWVSLRQNLILIVDEGTSQVDEGIRQGVWWGADFGREVYVPRSAVCEMPDGRLGYALVSKANAYQLADSLVAMGCRRAIQLDINGTWPVFFTFAHGDDGSISARYLDQRMGGNPGRYLNGSTKEFFAFFDPALVPEGSVLDA